jgi:hypothetical protein
MGCRGEFIRRLTDQMAASRSDRDGFRRLYGELFRQHLWYSLQARWIAVD